MSTVRPLFVSTYPPEECGLATFTRDSADAVDMAAREPVSSIAAIQKTRVAPLRRSARGPRHRQQPPGRLPSGRGGGQRRPVRRGELAARVRPLSGRLGQRRVGVRAWLPQALVTTFHTLLTQPDPLPRRIIQVLAAHSQGHRRDDQSRGAALGAASTACPGRSVQVIPHGVPVVPYPARRMRTRRGWDWRVGR